MSLTRKALKDFTFEDGTFIPKGTAIAAAARCVHHDDAFYPNAHEFEPFRFADLREEDGEGAEHQCLHDARVSAIWVWSACLVRLSFFLSPTIMREVAHVVLVRDVFLPQLS